MSSLATPSLVAPQPLHFRLDTSDHEAVGAVLSGDREMFEVIVRRYNARLYRVGMAYLRDHAQTEDAMQNAYLNAFLHLDRYRGAANFATWLTRIMINECLMLLRGRQRWAMHTRELQETDGEAEALVAPPSEPELDREDVKALLEQAIQRLPRNHRAVYLLREVQQLSTNETAQCLGLSRENVKVLLHRAREGLKAQLMKTAAGVELFDYSAPHCDPMTAKVIGAIRVTTPAWSAASSV